MLHQKHLGTLTRRRAVGLWVARVESRPQATWKSWWTVTAAATVNDCLISDTDDPRNHSPLQVCIFFFSRAKGPRRAWSLKLHDLDLVKTFVENFCTVMPSSMLELDLYFSFLFYFIFIFHPQLLTIVWLKNFINQYLLIVNYSSLLLLTIYEILIVVLNIS